MSRIFIPAFSNMKCSTKTNNKFYKEDLDTIPEDKRLFCIYEIPKECFSMELRGQSYIYNYTTKEWDTFTSIKNEENVAHPVILGHIEKFLKYTNSESYDVSCHKYINNIRYCVDTESGHIFEVHSSYRHLLGGITVCVTPDKGSSTGRTFTCTGRSDSENSERIVGVLPASIQKDLENSIPDIDFSVPVLITKPHPVNRKTQLREFRKITNINCDFSRDFIQNIAILDTKTILKFPDISELFKIQYDEFSEDRKFVYIVGKYDLVLQNDMYKLKEFVGTHVVCGTTTQDTVRVTWPISGIAISSDSNDCTDIRLEYGKNLSTEGVCWIRDISTSNKEEFSVVPIVHHIRNSPIYTKRPSDDYYIHSKESRISVILTEEEISFYQTERNSEYCTEIPPEKIRFTTAGIFIS